MKKMIMGLLITLVGCDSYKVGLFDNSALVARCTASAECEIDNYDDNDYYDISDEDALKQYLIESCVDSSSDNAAIAQELGCRAEYRAYESCMLENAPDSCDYDLSDSDDYEDYYEDMEEYQDETCWQPIQAYEECMLFY